jgi:hypothetical protein
MSAEVVLSLLLESFSFSLTDEEIVWNMAGVATPSIQGGPAGNYQLPLKVAQIRSV